MYMYLIIWMTFFPPKFNLVYNTALFQDHFTGLSSSEMSGENNNYKWFGLKEGLLSVPHLKCIWQNRTSLIGVNCSVLFISGSFSAEKMQLKCSGFYATQRCYIATRTNVFSLLQQTVTRFKASLKMHWDVKFKMIAPVSCFYVCGMTRLLSQFEKGRNPMCPLA